MARWVDVESVYLGELICLAVLDCQADTRLPLLECFGVVLDRVSSEGIGFLFDGGSPPVDDNQ